MFRRIFSLAAALGMLLVVLGGMPAQHARAQTAAQMTQVTQVQIHKDCAEYAPRAVICLDKDTDLAYPIYKGKVVKAAKKFDKRTRFGGWIVNAKGVREDHRTPNGAFKIIKFVRHAVSNIYVGVEMPNYIKFTYDGIGIHYSHDFDVHGKRISHGCAGLKSRAYSAWLFEWAKDNKPLIVVAKG